MNGMSTHIRSQIRANAPNRGAVTDGIEIIARLRKLGCSVAWYHLGGGDGINGRGHEARPISDFAKVILPGIQAMGRGLAMEPGRVIAGNAGILVRRVLYTKQSGVKRFLIQDAAMNDLIRPGAVRIVPSDLARHGACRLARPSRRRRGRDHRDRALGRGRTRLQERRLPGQRPCPALSRDDRWRPSRQAPTAWSWPPTTTRAPALPRSSLMGRMPAWSATANPTRIWSFRSACELDRVVKSNVPR